ncbi:MAG: hypothetical protein LAO05_06495 [Acidobacteriia bacterium]|nr:hypothetical protein [Terriglobia bacterium]
MNVLALVAGAIAVGAAAATALVLARYMPASPTWRRLRVAVYLVLAAAGVVRVVQTAGSNPRMAIFYAGLAAFVGALAYAASKRPSLE